MKSVYTFLKEYKQLRESETSERAAELGYEWQRRNVYVDPKSGKRYRGTGTKFEEIPDEQPAEKKPGQQAPQKTLDKFKQDAQERTPVAPQTPQPSAFPANPADDGQEAEMRAVAASQGLWPHYTNALKDYHINRQLQQIQADREVAQAELEAQQAELEAQQQAQVEEPPQKDPEEFRTVDDVVGEQENQEEINSILNMVGLGEEDVEYLSQQEQPELTETQMSREDERRQIIIDTLELMMNIPEKKRGVGANKLSNEDAELLKTYIEGNGPKIERIDISDEDLNFAKDYLKKNHKGAFTKLTLGSKGAPKERYDGRGDAVLKSYLSNRGLSAVTGKPLSYFASELDHIISLGNGGVDGFDNWAWVDKRYNQFMSSLDDEGVLKKLDKLINENPNDSKLKELKGQLSNEVRTRYGTYFKKNGTSGVSLEDIEEASGIGGEQMLKALASASGVNTYKGSDDRTRARGRFIGYPQLKQELIKKLKPVTREEMEEFDESLNEIRDFIVEKNKEMEPYTKRSRKKKGKSKIEESYDYWIELQNQDKKFYYTSFIKKYNKNNKFF